MIVQNAMPPYRMHCNVCGKDWLPRNARGKDTPTASSLDREALEHWQECEKRS